MTVLVMQVTNCFKCRNPVFEALADADQDAGSKRHPRLAREADCFQPRRRVFVG